MQPDVKLETDKVLIEGIVKVQGTDILLDSPERRSNTTPYRRALVHNVGDKLTINYDKDYPNGVEIRGSVSLSEIVVPNRQPKYQYPSPGSDPDVIISPNEYYATEIELINAVLNIRDHVDKLRFEAKQNKIEIKFNSKGNISEMKVASRPFPDNISGNNVEWAGTMNLIEEVLDLRDKSRLIESNEEGQLTKIIVANRPKKGQAINLAKVDLVNEVFDLRDKVADLQKRLISLEEKLVDLESQKRI